MVVGTTKGQVKATTGTPIAANTTKEVATTVVGGNTLPAATATMGQQLPSTNHHNDGRLRHRMRPQVKLNNILGTSNKRNSDLPTLPKYVVNGRPFVCWAHILGQCNFANCAFKNGHVPCSVIPDTFAEEVVTMLTLGVNHCARAREQEGSPGKHQRLDGQN